MEILLNRLTMIRKNSYLQCLLFSCVIWMALIHVSAISQQKQVLKIGMTTALSGPARDLGQSMKHGIEAYFHHINQKGGVHGRNLQLIALDDSYQPTSAASNMRRLIEEYKVIAVIGNVGTPTAMVTVPIANREKTLLFGAFTGSNILRKSPPDRYVINFRSSYEEETATMIDAILERGIKPDEVAFFTQNDGYGDAGYTGGVKALKAKGYQRAETLAHGRYTRNTMNVEDGLLTIFDAPIRPRAIIMVGTYTPCAKFIKLAKTIFPNAFFFNVSFVGSISLANALGKYGEGVIVTQVVPHFESDLPGVAEYRSILKKFDPTVKPDFVSLEGFLVAKVFVAGLKRTPEKVTRENLIDAIESIQNLDIGIGEPISFSPNEHQALHRVWGTQIQNGRFVDFE